MLGEAHNLYSRDAEGAVPPEYILASSLLGGFRGVFITVLWMRAQELKESGEYYAMIDMYKIISRLQPSHSAAWRFQAWDLSYNVSSEFLESYEDRVFWVFRGLDLLRKEAIPKNRKSPELYWELAWFFHHKIGSDIDPAYPYYQRHLAAQVAEALAGIPPGSWPLYRKIAALHRQFPTRPDLLADKEIRDRLTQLRTRQADIDLFRDSTRLLEEPPDALETLLKDPAVRSAVRTASLWVAGEKIETKLGMNPAEMYRLCESFGPIDWRAPASHSLYWATLGERIRSVLRPDRPTARYHYLLYRSAINLPYVNQPPGMSDAGVFSIPDYRFIDPVMRFVEETLEHFRRKNEAKRKRGETTSDVGLMRSFYEGFLSQIAMNAYFDGRHDIALRLLEKLKSSTGNNARYDASPEDFSRREIARGLEAMGSEEAIPLLGDIYTQACHYLSLENDSAYNRQRRWVEVLHPFCLRKWGPQEGVRPLDEILRRVVLEILEGHVPAFESEERIERFARQLRLVEPDLYRAVDPQREERRRSEGQ